jgi:hypothetical protein
MIGIDKVDCCCRLQDPGYAVTDAYFGAPHLSIFLFTILSYLVVMMLVTPRHLQSRAPSSWLMVCLLVCLSTFPLPHEGREGIIHPSMITRCRGLIGVTQNLLIE